MKDLITSVNYVTLIVVAALALLPVILSDYYIYIATSFALFTILALSVDLIWGYAGLLSIGHAAFFGAGAYASGILLRDYPVVPDLISIFIIIPLGVGLLALILSYLFFKAGLTGGPFAIMTLIITVVAERITSQYASVFGGVGGFGGIPDPTIFGLYTLTSLELYYIAVGMLVLVYWGLRWLVNSPFGSVIESIRDNEERTKFLGFNTTNYKILIFSLSAAIAAAAGSLYAPATGFLSPSITGLLLSTTIVIWVAVGGKGMLLGAIAGALFLQIVELFASEIIPRTWQILLALIFILVILRAPEGLVGLYRQFQLSDHLPYGSDSTAQK